MAILKCKMCGGDLNITEGASTAECEYCGSVQTVPKVDSEKKLNLFARANRLRAACEFDKAAGIYETIVADFPEEAEAYWGLVLCKYGIEYVDDPATGKKIPTCHRSGFDSVMKDQNVELTQEYADVLARRLYREEAKQIEELRKNIIAVSANEEPYDVFICYKETDFDGKRTLDSVLAMDIYEALTGKDYRVFFSRISLEDKLGAEYEPYIFAALHSAKIMLVIGTDYEYFNAVWVKNEWSRYLKLMVQDKSKHLIPCFKGIDAYDMPEEFARLQAQDLDKMGAIQDIVRGVEKLLPKQKQAVQETVVVQQVSAQSNPTIDSYLKRAFIFLEDCDWNSANEYCEKVLDIDPENAQAYFGKLLAELKVSSEAQLAAVQKPFDSSGHYKKILRFADDGLKRRVEACLAKVRDRIEQERIAQERREEEARIAQEKQAEERRIAEEKAAEERRIAEEKAAEERRAARAKANYNQAKKLLERGEKAEAYGYLRDASGYKDADTLLETIKEDIHSILAHVELNGKYGYINETGEMVIPPQFEYAYAFGSNGLALVKLNGKYGYINESGEMVIPPQFNDAYEFDSNGLAHVEVNGKHGYINEAGKMVIQSQFDGAGYFGSNGLAPVELNFKHGYINETSEMVIQPQFNNDVWEMEFGSNDLAAVKLNDKYGYINKTGEMVIQPRFGWARPFGSNGLASVSLNGKYGYINEVAKMVIAPQFEDAAEFFGSNGLAAVELNRRWGYINETGEMVIQPGFGWAKAFDSNGLAAVQQNGQWGYINEAGEMVIPPQFEDAESFGSNGLALVKLNGKYGYINETGEMVIPPQFEDACNFEMILHSEVGQRSARLTEARQKAEQQANWRAAGLCQHCGGALKGLFAKKCISCDKPKDY